MNVGHISHFYDFSLCHGLHGRLVYVNDVKQTVGKWNTADSRAESRAALSCCCGDLHVRSILLRDCKGSGR